MRILRSAGALGDRQRFCLALGFFDGVHLGHQHIIRQTISDARQHGAEAVVVTFDRHPNTVVAPDRVPLLIYPLPQKLRTIAGLGVDKLLLIRFDKAFSELSGEAFIRGLVGKVRRVHSLCVGENFRFGHGRSGNVGKLRALGKTLGFTVHGLASVALNSQPVSSTRIRKAIQSGDLDAAGQMLGRPYSVASVVVMGDQLGRRLGFPTANLNIEGLVLPPHGVYAATATEISPASQAREWPAVVNLGRRPTLGAPEPPLRLEAHLAGFHGDLYGREIEVTFLEKLRPEIQFSSLEALRGQIGRDLETLRLRWSGSGRSRAG